MQTTAVRWLTLQQGTARGSGLAGNREADTRSKVTDFKMSGCYFRAETVLSVTAASGMLGTLPASLAGCVSRAPPGGRYENLFIVRGGRAAPPGLGLLWGSSAISQLSLTPAAREGFTNTSCRWC